MLKPKLLIFELRMMGDAIMSLPFVRAAQKNFTVFVCCQPSISDVFRRLLPDEQIISWRPPWLEEANKYFLVNWSKAGFKGLLQTIRAQKFDVAISVWADPRTHCLMALSGAPKRIGFPVNRQNFYASDLPWRRKQIRIGKIMNCLVGIGLGRRLLTVKLHREKKLQHHVENWRQIAEALKLVWDDRAPWLKLENLRLPEPLEHFVRENKKDNKKIWLIHPGARTLNRRWPMERFRGLIEQVFIPSGRPVIFIDAVESPLNGVILPGAFVFRPADLREFFAVLRQVDYVICNDTGVSHAAAALGKRTISIFSANLPEWFAPYHNFDLVAQNNGCPLQPCLDRCSMPSFICLESVGIGHVKAQIEKLE